MPTTPTPPSSPTLSSLFASLSLSEYLSAFEKEKYLATDLPLLSADDLKELIPQGGPRKRLENWIKQQQQQQQQPTSAAGTTQQPTTAPHKTQQPTNAGAPVSDAERKVIEDKARKEAEAKFAAERAALEAKVKHEARLEAESKIAAEKAKAHAEAEQVS